MTLSELQNLIKAFCSEGTLTERNKEILRTSAKTVEGVSEEVLDALILAEITKIQSSQTPPPTSNQSGFVTTTPPPLQNVVAGNNLFLNVLTLNTQGSFIVQQATLNDKSSSYNGKKVIIKRMKPEFTAIPNHKEIFFKEYTVLQGIDHPNITKAIGKGNDTNGDFFYLESTEGKSLAELISQDKLDNEQQIKRVATELLSALEYCHQKGLIHNDIKPENIKVCATTGNVKIENFQLAAKEGSAQIATKTGQDKYAAPEQVNVEGVTDKRTDIFAFGMIFMEMLTGEATRDAITNITNPAYRDIIAKCLHREPQKRYGSCAEISNMLRSVSSVQQTVNKADAEGELRRLRDEADTFFKSGNFVEAQKLYARYLIEKPDDAYVRAQIDECRKNLSAKPIPPKEEVKERETKKFPWIWVAAGAAAVVIILLVVLNWGAIFNNSDDEIITDTTIVDNDNNIPDNQNDNNNNNNENVNEQLLYADKLFDEKNIVGALPAYESALTTEPNNQHITDRINTCRDIINNGKGLVAEVGPNGMYGFKEDRGYLVIDYQYSEALDFHKNKIAIVKQKGKWGCINRLNEVTIDFKYDRMEYTGQYVSGWQGAKGWMLEFNGLIVSRY